MAALPIAAYIGLVVWYWWQTYEEHKRGIRHERGVYYLGIALTVPGILAAIAFLVVLAA